MVEFIGALLGACAGTFVGLFAWHWYTIKKLDEEIKKLSKVLDDTFISTTVVYED